MEGHETDPLKGLRDENQKLTIRLTLAQAFVGLMHKAYDALLHYQVNYRNLPEYKDSAVLDEANKVPITHGRTLIMDWISRLERGIAAAIRRKQFKRYDNE